jgi:RNA polymerase sigma factor (sigma-70 family)
MSLNGSVSQWIVSLRAGEMEAIENLWNRYKQRLVELASSRLADSPKRVADEEDVAQSVFLSLCRGAAAGRFEDVRNRDDLWWLVLAITKQKVVDLVRRETAKKRGGGRVLSEASDTRTGGGQPLALDQLIGDMPTPELIVMLAEQNQRLLELLDDDRLRKIAVSRIEGYTVGEIATELAVSTRSIERKLQLIRLTWTEELVRAESQPD